jgi:hypothetical protein
MMRGLSILCIAGLLSSVRPAWADALPRVLPTTPDRTVEAVDAIEKERPPLPELDTAGLTDGDPEADGPEVDTVTEATESTAPGSSSTEPSSLGSASSPDDPYEASDSESTSLDGRIENGRQFVWAAYGVSWVVLMVYCGSVFRRWKTVSGQEDAG